MGPVSIWDNCKDKKKGEGASTDAGNCDNRKGV